MTYTISELYKFEFWIGVDDSVDETIYVIRR